VLASCVRLSPEEFLILDAFARRIGLGASKYRVARLLRSSALTRARQFNEENAARRARERELDDELERDELDDERSSSRRARR
jgi:hypothetical protein